MHHNNAKDATVLCLTVGFIKKLSKKSNTAGIDEMNLLSIPIT